MTDFAHFLASLRARRRAGPENLVVYSSVGSTNQVARRIVAEYAADDETAPSFFLVAFEQTGGVGRGGRPWASPAGLGVYATLALTDIRLAELQALPLLAAIGLCRAVNQRVGGRCRLKWPNDLLVEGRKIGGILLETVLRGGARADVLAGFGVNHGQLKTELPTSQATSLRLESAHLPSLADFACELLEALESALSRRSDLAAAVAEYRTLSLHTVGEALRLNVAGEICEGVFLGLDENGFLRLGTERGELLLTSGEVIER